MVTEFGEIKPHFRTTISPLIDGVDPLKEKKYRPPGRAINPKAELIGRIHLYEGTIRTVELGGILVQVQGFMDISQTFFADGETTNQPFIGWGLRDATTNRGIWQYSDSGICCDPVYAYRCTKILEELPKFSTDSDERINDFVSAATAAQRVFSGWEFEYDEEGDFGRKVYADRRRRMRSLIGRDKLREILQSLPPRLEEMMQAMYDKKRYVDTRNIERELRLKRLHPSEFYLDAIKTHHRMVSDLASGLEETGGVW